MYLKAFILLITLYLKLRLCTVTTMPLPRSQEPRVLLGGVGMTNPPRNSAVNCPLFLKHSVNEFILILDFERKMIWKFRHYASLTFLSKYFTMTNAVTVCQYYVHYWTLLVCHKDEYLDLELSRGETWQRQTFFSHQNERRR